GELLVAIQGAGIGQHLNADVVRVAVDIRNHGCGQLVHESCGVLPKHRNVRYLLDGHQRFGKLLSELVAIRKSAFLGIDVDHRHGSLLLGYDDHHSPAGCWWAKFVAIDRSTLATSSNGSKLSCALLNATAPSDAAIT